MVDGVLLDWEGVLADTGDARRDALRAALAAEGLHLDDEASGLSFYAAAVRAAGGLADPTLVDLIVARARRELAARPVELTAYCLKGTTRRDRYVRQGIVAADPRLFPLGRFVELYVGRQYVGRFLVDDTGERIQGGILDIWTPECRDARLFGRRRGTAVLVPRPRGGSPDTLLTGQLEATGQR